MKPIGPGVIDDRGILWTVNRDAGQKVYGERLRLVKGKELRAWTPYRSKIAALAMKSRMPWPDVNQDILYLGASTGTTVSHVSDLLRDQAVVYAVEFSPRSVRDLLHNLQSRDNVIPIMADANQADLYSAYIDRPVGAIVQDVAQRHQVDIFLNNIHYAAKGAIGYLFVKARSIDVARPLPAIYKEVGERLRAAGLTIEMEVDLEPFEKDHRAFVVRL